MNPVRMKYSGIILQHEDRVLLLKRKKNPNAGFFTVIGGHIEAGESPYQTALRECYEESGVAMNTLHFTGTVVWDIGVGMYVFAGRLPDGVRPETVAPCDMAEGQLQWWPLSEIDAASVSASVHHYVPAMLPDLQNLPAEWFFVESEQPGQIAGYEMRPLPTGCNPMIPFLLKES